MIIYRVLCIKNEYSEFKVVIHYTNRDDAMKAATQLQAMADKWTRYCIDFVEVF
jgi:hypothetical protein